ncbi:MAG TPA: alkaline phosphatase [Solirubrobacter sp.]|nr:alkaline phosphatase [Solirubrobacter sp.]
MSALRAAVLTWIAVAALAAPAANAAGRADRTPAIAAELNAAKPRNVAMLLLDGFDHQLMTAARDYELGADGRFLMDALPFWGNVTTHGLLPGPGPVYGINYVNDSAATASAWSTGHKTIEGRLSQGPSTGLSTPGQDYETVMQLAKAAGKRTANITDVDVTDATPAAMGASINNRSCQGPGDMGSCSAARKANGGKGSVAEQLVDNGIDVILGGGRARFQQNVDAGGTLLARATGTLGYRDVGTKQELAALGSLDGGPVLGLFASGYMATRYQPLVATASGSGSTSYRCQPQDRGNQPTLAEMTAKALELVDNPNGFFMQVESAQTDKGAHDGNVCGSLGQVLAADQALAVLLDYQRAHPDTLIVVTADHGHATQIVRPGEAKVYATLQTADGNPLRVGYSTSTSGQWHTGTQVPIAAKGPQAANVSGTIDQTDLFDILRGLPEAGADAVAPVTTAAVSPAADGVDGWHHAGPVTVTLSATDEGGSGVARTEYRVGGGTWTEYTAPVSLPATATVEFRSVDREGNVEAIRSVAVKIDGAAPVTTAEPSGGAYTEPVRVTLTATDGDGSGVDRIEYRLDGADWATYGGPFTVYTNGDHRVEYRAVDLAGNVETARVVTFSTSGLDGPPESCLSPISDEFEGSTLDPKWQILRSAPERLAVTGGKLQIRFDGTSADMNGSTRTATNLLMQPAPTGGPWTATTEIDMSDAKQQSNQAGFLLWQSEGPPNDANRFAKVTVNARTTDTSAPSRPSWWAERQLTVAGSTSGQGNGNSGYVAGLVPDTVYLRLASSGGTVQSIRTLYSLDGETWTEFLTPFTVDTSTLPLQIGLGLYRGENNPTGSARFGYFRVCDFALDALAPRTTLAAPDADGSDGWHVTTPVPVSLSASDGEGAGVARTEYRINGGAWTTFSAPFPVAEERVNAVDYRSVDLAGNTEPARTAEVKIDVTAPSSSLTLSPAAPGAGGTYTTPVTARLAGSDATSGVARLEYRVDGGEWTTYAADAPPVFTALGTVAIRHRAVDVAGNVSPASDPVTFTIAKPPVEVVDPEPTPEASATPTPTPEATATPAPFSGPPAGPPAGDQGGAAGPAVSTAVRPRAKAARGAVAVTLSCPRGATCSGTIRLQIKVRKRTVTAGKASFKLAGGASRTVKVKLNAAARSQLRRGALKVTVVTLADAASGKPKTYRATVRVKK